MMNFLNKTMLVALILTISFQSQAMFRQASRIAATAARSFKPALAPRVANPAARSVQVARAAMPAARPATARTFAASAFAPRIASASRKPLAGRMALFAGLTATMAGAGIAKAEGAEELVPKPYDPAKSKRIYNDLLENYKKQNIKAKLDMYGIGENDIVHITGMMENDIPEIAILPTEIEITTRSGKVVKINLYDNEKINNGAEKVSEAKKVAEVLEPKPAPSLILKDGKYVPVFENLKATPQKASFGPGFGIIGGIIGAIVDADKVFDGNQRLINAAVGAGAGLVLDGICYGDAWLKADKINATTKGLNLLGNAAQNNVAGMRIYVGENPENLIKQDNDDLSPLMMASATGAQDAVEYILKNMPKEYSVKLQWNLSSHIYGRRPSVLMTDKTGRTALDYARINGHTDIEKLLLAHGAKPGYEVSGKLVSSSK